MPSSSDGLAALRAGAPSPYRQELLRDALDVELLLADLGLDYERRGSELYARCPHPDHLDDGKNPNWSIRDDPGGERHGMHNCWSCDAAPPFGGDPVRLVSTVRDLPRDAAFEYLCELFGVAAVTEDRLYDLGISRRRVRTLAPPPEVPDRGERADELPRGARPVLPDAGDPFWRYLRGRGFRSEDLARYEVHGHARGPRWRDRVILPVRMDGRLVTYYGRSIDPACPKARKGLYPYGKGTLEGTLGGWDEVTGATVAVLLEGRFDEIYTRRVLAGWWRADVLSLLGGTVTEARARLLTARGYRTVVVLGDGDAGGVHLADSAYRRLRHAAAVYRPVPPPGLDPDQLSPRALRELLRNYRAFPAAARTVLTRVRYDAGKVGGSTPPGLPGGPEAG